MKQIVYNLNKQKAVINFFGVYEVSREQSYLPIYRIPAPRVIGSNEYFEVLEDSEASYVVSHKEENGFYKNDSNTFHRYYNSAVYPEES